MTAPVIARIDAALDESSKAPRLSAAELQSGLAHVLDAPREVGEVRLLVMRPAVEHRLVMEQVDVDVDCGVVGDTWQVRASSSTPDGSPNPQAQITVMNFRLGELVAQSTDRVALAGDQIYVDFDISVDNLPPGTLLALGTAVLRVSEKPHTGCKKFVARFGEEAMRFVNGRDGRRYRLRGMNTSVVTPGTIRVGDRITKVEAPHIA